MNIVASQVGIDVSKAHLDVSIDGAKPRRIANTEQACLSLAQRLAPGAVIHLEASGGYERTPRRVFRQAGFVVKTHDPLKLRRLAQATCGRGKTDALDAKHLAGVGASLCPQPEKSALREQLCDLSRTIQELKAMRSQLLVRAKLPGLDACSGRALQTAAKGLDGQIRKLETEFVKRIRGSELEGRYRLVQTVPCAGPCTARVVVSELPEDLSPFTPAQLVSYAGLAPIPDQSGQRTRPARLGRGNSRLKAALYMPSISCLHTQDWARDLYSRLRARGRAHQQAIAAVMRRLLLRIVAVLKRSSAWQAEPPLDKALYHLPRYPRERCPCGPSHRVAGPSMAGESPALAWAGSAANWRGPAAAWRRPAAPPLGSPRPF